MWYVTGVLSTGDQMDARVAAPLERRDDSIGRPLPHRNRRHAPALKTPSPARTPTPSPPGSATSGTAAPTPTPSPTRSGSHPQLHRPAGPQSRAVRRHRPQPHLRPDVARLRRRPARRRLRRLRRHGHRRPRAPRRNRPHALARRGQARIATLFYAESGLLATVAGLLGYLAGSTPRLVPRPPHLPQPGQPPSSTSSCSPSSSPSPSS